MLIQKQFNWSLVGQLTNAEDFTKNRFNDFRKKSKKRD